MSQRPTGPQQTRPTTYHVTIKSVLTFPLRMCNPPPAVAKVRSCGVTPLFKVRLEDVLNRNHLPPLGLKDFEEWLLYVEMSPENLYFTLWLREYRERYNAWMAQHKLHRQMDGEFRMNWETHHSPSLAMFYARAKQTFFTPNSPYELNLPSTLLAVFHTSMESPHPDPAIFTDVSIETYRLLDESLRRFVSAQFSNVGNHRVLCGIIAGVVFALIGSVPPIILNFTKSEPRWLRMLAFPGLFLGLTIFLSAMHGICLGVYVFGDLRQLRKFELARPPISRPMPLNEYQAKAVSLRSIPNIPPSITEEPLTIAEKPPSADGPVACIVRPLSITSEGHSTYSSSDEDGELSTGDHGQAQIHISPAFYDNSSALEIDGGVSTNFDTSLRSGDGQLSSPINSDFTMTAGFIHSFDTASIDFNDCDRPDFCPSQRQPIDAFDFDSLPPLQGKPPHDPLSQYETHCCPTSEPLPTPYPAYTRKQPRQWPPEEHPPSGFIARQQSRCDIKKWRLQTESSDQLSTLAAPRGLPPSSSPTRDPYNSHIITIKSRRSLAPTEATLESTETKVSRRFRLVNAVPAFAVPLTRVLSPVIRRGQWEIVVRSAVVAFLGSWAVVGVLVAVPVRR